MRTAEKRAAEVVAHGAALLDTVRPGWADQITRPVKVQSCTYCPLGQVFGFYSIGLAYLRDAAGRSLSQDRFASTHGFDRTRRGRLWWTTTAISYEQLNTAWEKEVASRRTREPVNPFQAFLRTLDAREEAAVDRALARLVADYSRPSALEALAVG